MAGFTQRTCGYWRVPRPTSAGLAGRRTRIAPLPLRLGRHPCARGGAAAAPGRRAGLGLPAGRGARAGPAARRHPGGRGRPELPAARASGEGQVREEAAESQEHHSGDLDDRSSTRARLSTSQFFTPFRHRTASNLLAWRTSWPFSTRWAWRGDLDDDLIKPYT